MAPVGNIRGHFYIEDTIMDYDYDFDDDYYDEIEYVAVLSEN